MILSLSSTPAQEGAWRVSESQWVGLLLPPSKAREPCPTSASVTEGLVARDLGRRGKKITPGSPQSRGPRPSVSPSSGKTTV